ncbi:MAG TPA: OmpA family protein [Leadbetterella sp.]|nr:OmpA family protein [Leadbetterella sp.]
MKQVLFIIFLLASLGVDAQVTSNPKIKKKSTKDVYINKVEITEDRTIFSMQFVAKTAKEILEEYLKENPKEKEQLQNMNPMMRNMILQQFLQQENASTISFQPTSYLKTSDGKKYKFIKATDIPTAPNRKDVEPGKKYFFKVYFEKIPKGFENIDLIEHDSDRADNFTYWNFFGININNPDTNSKPKALAAAPKEEVENEESEDFKLFGKVIDAVSNKPISAKILCYDAKTLQIIDSVQTSKSGSYEFMITAKEVLYKISSVGYDGMEESFDVGAFLKKGSYQKDLFLEPVAPAKQLPEVQPKPEIKEETIESIGIPVNPEKSTFKLDKVYFEIGESKVLPESFEQLDNLVAYLKDNATLKIQIEGHTDNQGDPKANKKLSLERAYNVREYLVSKGISGNRIKFVGLGDTQPVSANDTEENRKLNRRVEYKIID